MNIYFWGLLVSLAIYRLIGNYAGRSVKGMDDYFVAGCRLPTLFIIGALVASFLSTTAFLAETGFAYEGYAFLMLALVALQNTGYSIGAVSFGRFVRRSSALTLPEFFAKRFDSHAMPVLAGITTVIGLTAYLLGVTQGDSLHQIPEEELDPVEVKPPLVWPLVLMVSVLSMVGLSVVFYAVPYSEALGREFTFLSGESLLSLGYSLSIISLGLLAFWQVRRIYSGKLYMK